jgi:hypothetical protein
MRLKKRQRRSQKLQEEQRSAQKTKTKEENIERKREINRIYDILRTKRV